MFLVLKVLLTGPSFPSAHSARTTSWTSVYHYCRFPLYVSAPVPPACWPLSLDVPWVPHIPQRSHCSRSSPKPLVLLWLKPETSRFFRTLPACVPHVHSASRSSNSGSTSKIPPESSPPLIPPIHAFIIFSWTACCGILISPPCLSSHPLPPKYSPHSCQNPIVLLLHIKSLDDPSRGHHFSCGTRGSAGLGSCHHRAVRPQPYQAIPSMCRVVSHLYLTLPSA